MMQVKFTVIEGPHLDKEFVFDRRDSFLVGRSKDAHFRLSDDDPYFSRKHFVVEINPPRCRLIDMNSRNGIMVNGVKTTIAELKDGDRIQGGTTTFIVSLNKPKADDLRTITLEALPQTEASCIDRETPQIPGFQFVKKLGQGGMGVVYHAIRLQDQQPTAIKLIQPVAGTNRKCIAQFIREAEILSQLNHHRIVRLLDSGEHEGNLYLAMEYVEGMDAQQLVNAEGPQKISVAVRMICQALSGLRHAHIMGYVHRDIKPSNLLIGTVKKKREIKVADFGLARAYESSQLSGLTLNGEIGGTPAFMPPENITHYREVTPAADQYATAASLYYLLTGKYMFDFPKDLGGKLTMILANPPIPIQKRRSDIPVGLADVIHKAVSKEASDRFATTTAFREALVLFAK